MTPRSNFDIKKTMIAAILSAIGLGRSPVGFCKGENNA